MEPNTEEEKRLRERIQGKREEERLRNTIRNRRRNSSSSSSNNGRRRSPSPHRHRYRDDRYHRGGGGGYRDDYDRRYDRDHRGRGRYRPPDRHRPHSRQDFDRRPDYYDDDRRRARSRSPPRHRRRHRSRSRSSSYSSSSGSSRSSSSAASKESNTPEDTHISKDHRTIFLSQLIMRVKESDIRKFLKANNLKYKEIILLRDKRSGRHKGSAYVEMKRLQDVNAAVALSDKVPNFQRFPILIKASEAEKNAQVPTQINVSKKLPPLFQDGKLVQSQKVYLGNLDESVTAQHLQAVFMQLGHLTSVSMQKDFAFLQFHDPQIANLAIQTFAGQDFLGKALKTGWATNQIASSGAQIVTSEEFPTDATARVENAFRALGQITRNPQDVAKVLGSAASGNQAVGTVAEARAGLAKGTQVAAAKPPPQPADPTVVGNKANPTKCILIHNMFDKDQETDPGWEKEIEEEFVDECSKFGKLLKVVVVSKEIGGKIYASFDSIQSASACASALAGRWFDKRQLRAEYVAASVVEQVAKDYGR